MNLIYHPRTRSDVREILAYYDERSEVAGDQFFEELQYGTRKIVADPNGFPISDSGLRRFNLKRFPYHVLYDIKHGSVRVWVVKHHKRHPSFGLRRSW